MVKLSTNSWGKKKTFKVEIIRYASSFLGPDQHRKVRIVSTLLQPKEWTCDNTRSEHQALAACPDCFGSLNDLLMMNSGRDA